MTAILTAPVNIIPPTFVDKVSRIAMMDENGLWRFVPEDKLSKVPFAIRLKITPQIANQILATRNPRNRKLSNRQVDKYVADMVEGRWKTIGDCISFDKEGNLINGQHRLKAVINSGKAIEFMVMFGAEPDSVIAIDEGRKRSNLDVAHLTGMKDVFKFDLSIASYLLEEKDLKRKMSRPQILAFYEQHKEAINFVSSRLTSRIMQKAPIGAVCARAYYTCVGNQNDLDRLEKFIDLVQKDSIELATMNITDSDMAPITLNNFVLRSKGKNTGTFRKELYNKTKSSVWNFLRGISVTKLFGIDEEKFFLPGE